ncbi:alanine racemase [Kineosporia sp. A_224]|uniref:alanine racemase n=1 Tax=Kineosporia sp. A_224 TaxID=1962180 RepID=UPI000B4A9249|nr:alanine racemase [Kineosporia sp. A_224]
MTFTACIDLAAWRDHLRRVVAAEPGVVPVLKGDGYGLGLGLVAAATADLAADSVARGAFRGIDTVAAGTPAEAALVAAVFPGDVLVLEACHDLRTPSGPDDVRHRVVRTVADGPALEAALEALASGHGLDPFVIEVETGMHRQGVPLAHALSALHRLRALGDDGAGRSATCRGLALHLPLRGGPAPARAAAVTVAREAPGTTLWVSHLGAAGVQRLVRAAPQLRIRERVGSRLWLGAPGAVTVTGTVLDVRRVPLGARIGYSRKRTGSRTLVLVSGGTVHGVGLRATAPSLRGRAVAAVEALAALVGVWRSPFTLDGRRLAFADTPHMQVSMLALPRGARVPRVGERLPCRVRMTTARFDAVTADGPQSGGLSVSVSTAACRTATAPNGQGYVRPVAQASSWSA